MAANRPQHAAVPVPLPIGPLPQLPQFQNRNWPHAGLFGHFVPPKIITHDTRLGSGAFGSVRAYVVMVNGIATWVAQKHFGLAQEFQKELQVAMAISTNEHPCVLAYIQHSAINQTIDYKLYVNFALDKFIKQQIVHEFYTFDDVKAWAIDILIGVEHLNNVHGRVHLDLKPSNIFLDENFEAVIGDIGSSQLENFGPDHTYSDFFAPPENGTFKATPTLLRQLKFYPEMKQYKNYDSFSIGAILTALIHYTQQDFIENLKFIDEIVYDQVAVTATLANVEPWFLHIISKMLIADKDRRPSISAILDSPIIIREIMQKNRPRRWIRIASRQRSRIDDITSDVFDARRESALKEGQIQQLTTDINLVQQVLGTKDVRITKLELDINGLTLDNTRLTRQANNRQKENLKIRQSLDFSNQRRLELETQVNDKDRNIQTLSGEKVTLEQNIQTLTSDLNNLNITRENLETQLGLLQQETQAHDQEKILFEKSITDLQNQLNIISGDKIQLEAKVQDQKTQLDASLKIYLDLQNQFRQETANSVILSQQIANLTNQNQTKDQTISDLQLEMNQRDLKLTSKITELQEAAAVDNTRLNLIIANHESTITSLNSNLQNMTDLNSNLQQQLIDTIAAHSAHLQQLNQKQKIEIQNLNQKFIDIQPTGRKQVFINALNKLTGLIQNKQLFPTSTSDNSAPNEGISITDLQSLINSLSVLTKSPNCPLLAKPLLLDSIEVLVIIFILLVKFLFPKTKHNSYKMI